MLKDKAKYYDVCVSMLDVLSRRKKNDITVNTYTLQNTENRVFKIWNYVFY